MPFAARAAEEAEMRKNTPKNADKADVLYIFLTLSNRFPPAKHTAKCHQSAVSVPAAVFGNIAEFGIKFAYNNGKRSWVFIQKPI